MKVNSKNLWILCGFGKILGLKVNATRNFVVEINVDQSKIERMANEVG